MKKIFPFVIITFVSLGFLGCKNTESDQNENVTISNTNPLNAEYIIEGEKVMVKNGKAESPIANTTTKKETLVVGTPLAGDLNADGINDYTVILAQNPGGSGTFFYVAAALTNPETKVLETTNTILLGDRILPQDIVLEKGIITVPYLIRKSSESMATIPSQLKKDYFQIQENSLIKITEETLASGSGDSTGSGSATTSTMGQKCIANSGNWNEEFKECEGVNQSWCESNGGKFNECASACRNDPTAEICTMQCVIICKF